MAERQQSDKDDKDATPQQQTTSARTPTAAQRQTTSQSQQPASSVPTTVQQAVVQEATAPSVQGSSDPLSIGGSAAHVTAPTSVAALELAVAGEPLHRMRRYLELIQATSVELPNSEPLAALLTTVRVAMQQLFTVPTQLDDTP